MKILVGSTSEPKLAAVQEVWPDADVQGVAVKSCVPNQPLNQEEIIEGAANRLFAIKKMQLRDGVNLAIGIENGIIPHEDGYVDIAFIAVHDYTTKSVSWLVTSAVPVPTTYTYNPEVTWGDFMHTQISTIDPQDPHLSVSGVSRKTLLTEALRCFLSKLVCTATAPLDPSLLTVKPFKGVPFVNVNKLLHDPKLWETIVKRCVQYAMKTHCTGIAMLGARGFLLGSCVAAHLGKPCTMIRKKGKLPGEVVTSDDFEVEYRSSGNVCEMDVEVFGEGDRVLVIDDILATGGSMKAAFSLVKKVGAEVAGGLVLHKIPRPDDHEGTWGTDLDNVNVIFSHEGSKEEEVIATAVALVTASREDRTVGNVPCCVHRECKDIIMCHPDVEYMVNTQPNYVPMSWDTFPDGSPNLHFHAEVLDSKTVTFVMSWDRMSTVNQQMQIVRILGRQKGVKGVTIIIPYLSVGTMERVDTEGTVATAETTLRMLTNGMPSGTNTKTRVVIGDPHAGVVRFFVSDDVVPYIVKLFETSEFMKHIPEDAVIVYPDEGARKRFMSSKLYKSRPTITCIKRRVGEERLVEILDSTNFDMDEEERKETTFVVLDDLVRSGGTLLQCAKALQKRFGHAIHLRAMVTHLAFDYGKERRFLHSDCVFESFIGFNTVARTRALDGHGPFKVLDALPHLLLR